MAKSKAHGRRHPASKTPFNGLNILNQLKIQPLKIKKINNSNTTTVTPTTACTTHDKDKKHLATKRSVLSNSSSSVTINSRNDNTKENAVPLSSTTTSHNIVKMESKKKVVLAASSKENALPRPVSSNTLRRKALGSPLVQTPEVKTAPQPCVSVKETVPAPRTAADTPTVIPITTITEECKDTTAYQYWSNNNELLKNKPKSFIETVKRLIYAETLENQFTPRRRNSSTGKKSVTFSADTMDYDYSVNTNLELVDKSVTNLIELNLLQNSTDNNQMLYPRTSSCLQVALPSLVRFYLRELFYDVLNDELDCEKVYKFHKTLTRKVSTCYRHVDVGAAVHFALNQLEINSTKDNDVPVTFLHGILKLYYEKKDSDTRYNVIQKRIENLCRHIEPIGLVDESHLVPLRDFDALYNVLKKQHENNIMMRDQEKTMKKKENDDTTSSSNNISVCSKCHKDIKRRQVKKINADGKIVHEFCIN